MSPTSTKCATTVSRLETTSASSKYGSGVYGLEILIKRVPIIDDW
jgi:hypothetical protein